MFEIRQTDVFTGWMRGLRDERGNFGDHKAVGGPVSELRVPFGPGYRVYYTLRGGELVVLLCGGDKGSQRKDIARARQLAEQLE